MSAGVGADELARVLASVGTAGVDKLGAAGARLAPPNPARAATAELGQAVATLAPLAPELLCRVCGKALDMMHADQGTHAECDPVPDPGPEPPSTLNELRGILIDYDNSRPRSVQTAIGPSEIAVPCDRRLAYSARGVPEVPDPRLKWAPLMGTAVHTLIAEAVEQRNRKLGRERWLVERKVWPDPSVYGSCDVYDFDTDTVIDWKLVGKSSLDKYRRKGPGPQYEGQSHLYGRGWQRAGLVPKHVRVVFLARLFSFDDSHEWTAPYSRRVADAALDRMYRIMALTRDLGVDADPGMWAGVPSSPGPDCWFCPFYRRGGPADATGCPGDVAATKRRNDRWADGLIVPKDDQGGNS